MKKPTLAICDTDEKYCRRLQDVLRQRENFPFAVSIYTDADRFLQTADMESFSIILACHEVCGALREQAEKPDGRIVLLRQGNEDALGLRFLQKYQSGEAIRRALMEIYADMDTSQKEDAVPAGGRRTRIIGVYSPVCREIQTSFSLLMGQFLARNASVLYMNFEPFSGLSKLLGGDSGRDLTDLIYYLEGGRDRLVYKLESMVSNVNGLDYISPAFSFIDLGLISAQSWKLLLQTLRSIGSYDYLLLDLSELVQGLLDVLRDCDLVYTIANREGFAIARMEQYEDLLRHLDYDDVMEHARRCDLPMIRKLPESIEELPYSDLAGYVKRLVNEELSR